MGIMNPIEEVSLEGFQIVASDMFIHLPRKSEATCTIWPSRVSFSKLTLSALNNCEFVRIEVNPRTKCLIVVPVTSSDKDSIRWIKGAKEFCIRNVYYKVKYGASNGNQQHYTKNATRRHNQNDPRTIKNHSY